MLVNPMQFRQNAPVITRVIAAADKKNGLVLYADEHGPPRAIQTQIGYSVRSFPLTSPKIVKSSSLQGDWAMYLLREGECKPRLAPSKRPSGIEAVEILDAEVRITFVGLGGAGVTAVQARENAEFVKGIEVLEESGGRRTGKAIIRCEKFVPLTFAVDNTDIADKGATWRVGYDIAYSLSQAGIPTLVQTNVQLDPECINKSRNNVVTVTTIAVKPENKEAVMAQIKDWVFEQSLVPEKTGLAFFDQLVIPKELTLFGRQAKRKEVTLKKAVHVAEKSGVVVFGDYKNNNGNGDKDGIGVIGAVAALAYWNKQMKGALDAYGWVKKGIGAIGDAVLWARIQASNLLKQEK